MRIEIFTSGNVTTAIPINKIHSIRWFKDSLLLYVEAGPVAHTLFFDTLEEGEERFQEILSNLRSLQ